MKISLSPAAIEAGRAFYEAHPVFEMEQLREIAVEGPGGEMVRVKAGRCLKCGFELSPAASSMHEMGQLWPADAMHAVRFTHAWDQQSRSVYCGGAIQFLTESIPPVLV